MRLWLSCVLAVAVFAAGCGGDEKEREASGPPKEKPVLCYDLDTAVLMGKTLGEARVVAQRAGCTIRVERADDTQYMQTKDLRDNRIGVELDDGAITKVTGIG